MLQILTRRDRETASSYFTQIFRARALVFRDRMGWDVTVEGGLEIDRFDDEHDPIYLAVKEEGDVLTGSLRLLPTTSETMLSSEFQHFFNEDLDICSPSIWECTRFCVHPLGEAGHASSQTAAVELLSGLCRLSLKSGIEHIMGVYDVSMIGVYRRIGWSPAPLARSRPEIGNLYVGLWEVSEETDRRLEQRLKAMRKDDRSPSLQFASSSSANIQFSF